MCIERHVHECPDYANSGSCQNRRCRLPHVDRAWQIRKHLANNPDDPTGTTHESSGQDDNSDLSSEDEDFEAIDSDDVDSDGLDDHLTRTHMDEDNRLLSQQQDFVHF